MNAVSLYRVAHWLAVRRVPLLPVAIRNIIFLLYNSYIPPTAQIGAGSVFAYGAIGVVIHAHAVIGRGCVIGQGITIGTAEPYFSKVLPLRCPQIGDNVYLAAGAKILGDIRIGNNAVVAAGAVVTHDVPDNAIVAGVPARIIGQVEPGYLAIRA